MDEGEGNSSFPSPVSGCRRTARLPEASVSSRAPALIRPDAPAGSAGRGTMSGPVFLVGVLIARPMIFSEAPKL
jgi:hypothetical protein